MKNIFILMLMILFTMSCEAKVNNPLLKMNCLDAEGLFRCENEEVICYTRPSHGTSCKFKEVK